MEYSDEIVKNKIRDWRRKKRISQLQLAQKIGVSQPWISAAEKSTHFSEIESVINATVENYANTTIDDLVERKAYMEKSSYNILELQLKMLSEDINREKETARSLLTINEQLKFKVNMVRSEIAKVYSPGISPNEVQTDRTKLYEEVFDKILAVTATLY